MNLSFDTRLPLASLLREARERFGARNGLNLRDEGAGVLTFSDEGRWVRLAIGAALNGVIHVEASTETLDEAVHDFRDRVAPTTAIKRSHRRLAAGEDLERFRRLMERQPAPPASIQTKSTGFGGGLNPG